MADLPTWSTFNAADSFDPAEMSIRFGQQDGTFSDPVVSAVALTLGSTLASSDGRPDWKWAH